MNHKTIKTEVKAHTCIVQNFSLQNVHMYHDHSQCTFCISPYKRKPYTSRHGLQKLKCLFEKLIKNDHTLLIQYLLGHVFAYLLYWIECQGLQEMRRFMHSAKIVHVLDVNAKQSLLKYFSCESNELISHVYCLPLTLSDAALWCEETKLCVNLYSQVLTITNQSVLIDN